MSATETKEKKNLLIELAKRKAANKSAVNRLGILGRDLSTKFAKAPAMQTYSKRGGRNGSGKP